MRAWTLGYPPAYEQAVRIPGNAKAPGGYAFRTKAAATRYVNEHPEEAGRYRPYEIELDAPFDDATTTVWRKAQIARHAWHTDLGGPEFMPECGVCSPPIVDPPLECRLLLVRAPFVNPDTGAVA